MFATIAQRGSRVSFVFEKNYILYSIESVTFDRPGILKEIQERAMLLQDLEMKSFIGANM